MRLFCYIISFFALLLLPILPVAAKCVVLKDNYPLQPQMSMEGITYRINCSIDLSGTDLKVPKNCVLVFSKKGIIKNGTIIFDETELKGKINLDCLIKGSIRNDLLKISSFNTSDPRALTRQLSSVFNLEKPCHVLVDRNVELDGSQSEVAYISLSGKKTIKNCCSFKVKGDINLREITIEGFEGYREVFLDYSNLTNGSSIILEDILFDGGNKIDRFLYCPYKQNIPSVVFQVKRCQFTHINNYVICFRSNCTGTIKENTVAEIGTSHLSNVCGFHLGDSDLNYNACNFVIEDNHIHDFVIPYSNVHDSREAHAVLLYGHGNVVKNNRILNFYTEKGIGTDMGMDSEGIYIKGGNNLVEANTLENCIGSSPDGAITVKSLFSDNRIRNNTINHRYGIGIQCYTPNSTIEGNVIESSAKAEACIAMLANSNTVISGNEFYVLDDSKSFQAAIELNQSKDIEIRNNSFVECSSVLCTYGCDGGITFSDNKISITGKVYGSNTYYTAPIALHNDKALFKVYGNDFNVKKTRASQLIEASEKFDGSLKFSENTVNISKEENDNSVFTYLVRNVDKLAVENNHFNTKHNSIGKISNRHIKVEQ